MSEDKNLNGVPDDEEVSVDDVNALNEEELKGDGALEEMNEVELKEVKDVLSGASGEANGSETSDSVPEEVLPLTVSLTFGDEVVELDVTEEFQLDLRKVCNDQGSRFDEFEVEGDLDPQNLRLLMNALK